MADENESNGKAERDSIAGADLALDPLYMNLAQDYVWYSAGE